MAKKKESFWKKLLPESVQNVLWIALFFGMVGILFSAVENTKKSEVGKIQIEIDQLENGSNLISKQDVEKYLKEYFGFKLTGLELEELDVDLIEDALQDYPYIKEADVYISSTRKISIQLSQREPVLRIIGEEGKHFYLDKEGEQVPVSRHFTARVPVVNGNIPAFEKNYLKKEKGVLKDVFVLNQKIQSNPFLQAMVEQIYVDKKEDFVLIPKVGKEKILFGSIENADEKLNKLQLFYQHGIRNEGWNKYKLINLTIDDQVVCERIAKKENQ